VQAEVEGVVLDNAGAVGGEVVGVGSLKVELKVTDADGKERTVGAYRMAEKTGLMPLLKFAHVSSKGVDSADLEGMAALYDMIRDSIHEDEWDRFERDATEAKADDKEIFAVVQAVVEVLAQGRTRSRSDSRAGRRQISAKSKGSSQPTGTADRGLTSVDSLLDR
jgi:hypothetical protein